MKNRFSYKTDSEFKEACTALGVQIPWSDNLSALFSSWIFGRFTLSNRFLVHPMEGFDSNPDGSPGPLSVRKYKRFAAGGCAAIWMEATSVTQDGRSNPGQLYLHRKSLDGFKSLLEDIHTAAHPVGEKKENIKTIIQLTHSGRYAKPEGRFMSKIVSQLDGCPKVSDDETVLTDDQLKWIRDAHVEAAILARKAGVDAVDVKACHGYLLHELLFARHRNDSAYGGLEFSRRYALMKEIIAGIRETEPHLVIASRINVYDGFDGGFATDAEDNGKADFSELKDLIAGLEAVGVDLWSFTAGIPYRNPWIGRPFDKPANSAAPAPEHPLVGVARMIELCYRAGQLASRPVVGAGLSWLRTFFPQVAAGILMQEQAQAIGFGRLGIAYPDLVKDLYHEGRMESKKVCVACSGCTNLMRGGKPAGCIIRDKEVYAQG